MAHTTSLQSAQFMSSAEIKGKEQNLNLKNSENIFGVCWIPITRVYRGSQQRVRKPYKHRKEQLSGTSGWHRQAVGGSTKGHHILYLLIFKGQ